MKSTGLKPKVNWIGSTTDQTSEEKKISELEDVAIKSISNAAQEENKDFQKKRAW